MTWRVMAKTDDGRVIHLPCNEPRQVLENLIDQRSRGRKVWIENERGEKVDETMFIPKDVS
jgi:hypothetical protein